MVIDRNAISLFVCISILILLGETSYAAECLSKSVTQQAGAGIADPINVTELTTREHQTAEDFLKNLTGRWRGTASKTDCGRAEGTEKSTAEYSINVESNLILQDRNALYLKFFAELDDKENRLVSPEPYDFYLLTDAEMRNKKHGRVLRFGHETTGGDTEILELSTSQIVFTQRFKRIRSEEPHEFVRTFRFSGDKALAVEELHYIEGELGIIKQWSLKRK